MTFGMTTLTNRIRLICCSSEMRIQRIWVEEMSDRGTDTTPTVIDVAVVTTTVAFSSVSDELSSLNTAVSNGFRTRSCVLLDDSRCFGYSFY
jgi:hypothetical protein